MSPASTALQASRTVHANSVKSESGAGEFFMHDFQNAENKRNAHDGSESRNEQSPVGGADRIAPHASITTRDQILEQARHARQPPSDRARRQPRLPVLDPHHPLAATRRALLRQEREHISRPHLRRLLADHLEEHLQVIRNRQPRIRRTPCADELQIAVHQRNAPA
jgi:hypothetical protein